ncbi:MAG: hypothetical protein V4459_07595 [Pseudomonadota bacterium]
MRGSTLLTMALLAPICLGASPAKAPPAKAIAAEKFVEWTPANGPRVWTAGGVTATLGVRRNRDSTTPIVTVSAPGMTPLRIEAEENFGSASVYVGIGSLKTGEKPSVIVQSWTGGAHCCMHIVVVSPVGSGYRLIDMGSWDGDQVAWPRDVSGDGIADFVFRDQRFLYAFGSYAGSWPPPLIMNIRGLKPVDVSADPAFRPLFAAELAETRKECLEGDSLSGGACAGYLANAARLGQFDPAWAKVAKTRAVTGGIYPASCSDTPRPKPCYSDFASAVRAFLRAGGYLR